LNQIGDSIPRFRSGDREQLRSLHKAFGFGLSILLGCGSILELSAQNGTLDEPPRSLHGSVVNGVTHEPLGHALVFSPDHRFAAVTDDQGHFEFALPRLAVRGQSNQFPAARVDAFHEEQERTRSLGPIQLDARKPGFLEGGAQQDIALDQKEVTITLTPEALIVGRVVLPDEADRIPVEIYRRQIQDGRASWTPEATAIAKSNGEFRFAGLRAGKYKLLTQEVLDRDPLTFDPRGQLYGYPPAYFSSAPDFGSAATIEVAPGGTFQATLSPVRQAYYQVSVPIANTLSDSQIQVAVSARGHRGPGFSLGYNQQEQRIEGLLPEGSYTVEASSNGPAVQSGTLVITVKGAALQGPPLTLVQASPIVVNVKEEFTSPNYPNSVNWNINGRNVEVKGPMRYLQVRLWPAGDFGLESSTAMVPPWRQGDESLTIPAQPGSYWVQADSSRGFPASITSGGIDLRHHPLEVGRGGSNPPIEITMRDDWAQIEAKIGTGDESLPDTSASRQVAGTNALSAWVCLLPLPDSPGVFQQFGIAPIQESAEAQVAPGEYRVLTFDHQPQDLEYRDPDAMRGYDGKGPAVRFLPGQKEHVTLPLVIAGDAP